MEKVRAGVIGLGRGKKLAAAVGDRCRNLQVVALCDILKDLVDEAAKELNIEKVYYDIDDMLKDEDIDAVIVASPFPMHADHVCRCLEAGKHVLSEVLACTTLDECDRIYDAVRKSGLKYMMEENYCYYRPLTIAHSMIKDGLLGDIYYAESDYLMDFHLRKNFPDVPGPWRKKAYFGTKGHPYITHSLGPLCFVMGEQIKTVSCMSAGESYPGFDADRIAVLLLKTESGKLIRLRSSFLSPRPNVFTYYAFQGTKGCYEGKIGPSDFHRVHIRGEMGNQEWKNVYDYKDAYLPSYWDVYPEDFFDDTVDDCCSKFDSGLPVLLEKFADSILHDTEPEIDVRSSLNWTAAGILSDLSARNGGQPVEVPVFR